ncbi:hypothetical protein G9F31_01040 [Acinetobacter sp. 187]|uniref:hypothetical protein n=1 Tax=Acinetobacter lanii TaxID=2715163 RepID=UPI00140C7E7C|nr:hypothetical protein [Acinetobacter lanii]NHC02370.1 hypothetical protein [Acinetobacter lanii]
MNLIEQLGGYEKAKEWYAKEAKRLSAKGWWSWDLMRVQKEMLEYRREHGIYEIGDKVVGTKLFDDRIFEFQYYLPELSMAVISKDGAAVGLNQLRHAESAEIKANKRLEVG